MRIAAPFAVLTILHFDTRNVFFRKSVGQWAGGLMFTGFALPSLPALFPLSLFLSSLAFFEPGTGQATYSLLLRRFVFRMAEASTKRE